VLEPAIDTGGPMGRMVLTVLGMVAEMELGFIRDRQRAGIDAAKAKGIYNSRLLLSTAYASCHCARKSPRPSGANEGTSTRRLRLRAALGWLEASMDRDRRALLRSGRAMSNLSR
jgi:DNA invertase Pin-like site-specific DNA recombinase